MTWSRSKNRSKSRVCSIKTSFYQEFLDNYLFVTIGMVGGACSDVAQTFHQVERFEKREKLKDLMSECNPKDKTLVFVKTKKNADFVATFLSGEGLPTTSIHGKRMK